MTFSDKFGGAGHTAAGGSGFGLGDAKSPRHASPRPEPADKQLKRNGLLEPKYIPPSTPNNASPEPKREPTKLGVTSAEPRSGLQSQPQSLSRFSDHMIELRLRSNSPRKVANLRTDWLESKGP